MLARLYDLPETLETYRAVEEEGVILRRPQGYERHILAHWVGEHFSPKWVSEAKVAIEAADPRCVGNSSSISSCSIGKTTPMATPMSVGPTTAPRGPMTAARGPTAAARGRAGPHVAAVGLRAPAASEFAKFQENH